MTQGLKRASQAAARAEWNETLTERQLSILHALCGDGPEVQCRGDELDHLADRGLLTWERRIRAKGSTISFQERIRPTAAGKKAYAAGRHALKDA